jgi:hypothetical protein
MKRRFFVRAMQTKPPHMYTDTINKTATISSKAALTVHPIDILVDERVPASRRQAPAV